MELKKPLRVLYVDTGIGLAGGQRGLMEILRHVDPALVEPVVASPPGSALEAYSREARVPWVELTSASDHVSAGAGFAPWGARGIACSWRGVGELAGAIKGRGIDLVHANTFKGGLVAGLAARLTRRPLIFHDRTLFGHPPVGYLLWALASRIIVISRAVEAKYPRSMAGKIRLIPDMVDVERLKPPSARSGSGRPVVGYLGRISPEKGLIYLVRAAPRVIGRTPEVLFRIGGEAFTAAGERYLNQSRREIDGLGLGGRFEFSGYVDDVPGFMSGISLLALPSESEGLGTVVLEAMAMERPVVAFDTGGQREIIDDGVDGYLVPGLDCDALADGVARVLEDGEAAVLMGKRGREKIVARYSSAAVTAAIVRVYAEVDGS